MSSDDKLLNGKSIYFDILYAVIFCLLVVSLGTDKYRNYMISNAGLLAGSLVLSIVLYGAGLWYYIKIVPKEKFIKPLTIYVLAVILINSVLFGIHAPEHAGFFAFLYGLVFFNRYTFFSLLFLSVVGAVSRKLSLKYFMQIKARPKDYAVLIVYLIIITSIPWLVFICSGKQFI